MGCTVLAFPLVRRGRDRASPGRKLTPEENEALPLESVILSSVWNLSLNLKKSKRGYLSTNSQSPLGTDHTARVPVSVRNAMNFK